MNLSEIGTGTSLKYDYPAIGKQEAYTLIGIFVELPNRYKKDNGNYSQKPGLFLGYIKGTSQFKKLKVYFYNSDKDATDSWENVISHDSISMNINRLSATRMPKKVSDYLKALHKQYQDENKRQEEIKRLEDQSSKATETINKLSANIVDSLEKETSYKPDYKNMPDLMFYATAKQHFKKTKHKYDSLDVYVSTRNKENLLILELELPERYYKSDLKLYAESGPYDYARSYKMAVEQMTKRDKAILESLNTGLNKIKPLTYGIRLNLDPELDGIGHMIATYELKIHDKSKLESILEQLGKIF